MSSNVFILIVFFILNANIQNIFDITLRAIAKFFQIFLTRVIFLAICLVALAKLPYVKMM